MSYNQFTSTMKMKYQNPLDKGAEAAQLSVGEKLNLKASHFNLGGAGNQYATTQKQHYQGKQIKEPAALNEAQKNELRNNHFVLGHQGALQMSTNRTTYTEKPLQPNLQNEQDVQKNKMRSHHHNFAESSYKMMQTTQNKEFQAPPPEYQRQHQENLMDKVVAIRKSNIILGKEQLPIKSIQQGDYVKKDGQAPESVKQGFQHTHFYLGDAKQDYKTMNQEYFYAQQAERNPFAEENRANLRATHFTLGKEGQAYQSEQQSHYRPYSETKMQYPNHTKFLQSSHFNIGDPRFMNHKTQTAYTNAMKCPEIASQGQARDQQQDRGSNFVIGSDNTTQIRSEMQQNYKNPNGEPARLNDKLLKDLRSSHFGFNDYQKNGFLTTKQANSIKEQGSINKLDEHATANLRSHHFILGKTNGVQLSQTHEIHRPLNGKPNELNERQANNLRRHHFEFS